MKGSLVRDFQVAHLDSIYSAVLFAIVVLGGQWADFVCYLLPAARDYYLAVLLLWICGTYALCSACLPPGSFNPWVLLTMEVSTQQKALRILAQFLSAAVFALFISFLDAKVLSGKLRFDRDFIGIALSRLALSKADIFVISIHLHDATMFALSQFAVANLRAT